MPTQTSLSLQPTYDQPDKPIFTDELMQQTPMRRLALESVKAERGAQLQSIADEARAAIPQQQPQQQPAPEQAAVQRKILSPQEWMRSNHPELARVRQVPRSKNRILQAEYAAYVDTEQNAQQQDRYGRQEAAVERRHGEDMGLRREEMKQRGDIAGRRAELNPEQQAMLEMMTAYKKEHPNADAKTLAAGVAMAAAALKGGAGTGAVDPLKEITAKAIEERQKTGEPATATRGFILGQGKTAPKEASFLDKTKVQEDLTGDKLGNNPGLMGFDQPGKAGEPPVGKLKGFEAIAAYVKREAPLGDPAQREKLRQLLVANRPTPEEIQAAFDAHDPLFWGEDEGIMSKLFVRGKPSEAERQAQAMAKAAEYTRMVMAVGE